MDANANPDPGLTPPNLPSWLRQNGANLAVGGVVMFLVFKFLNPLDVFLAAAGLTLIIFLHELGHFAAAKACKVRVETFSIGFGPALPFCSYKYGETTYKLSMVPLGGYVKMLGEGDGAADEDAEEDPRSFKNQSVGERMIIISAGVIMNLILGSALFLVVYMHGLEEKPAVASSLEPGGAAWRVGMHSGTQIKKIGSREEPWFEDIMPVVWSTSKGEQLPLTIEYRGATENITAEPLLEDGAAYPILGIRSPESLTLATYKRNPEVPPFRVGSPASRASSPGFRQADTIAAMTDPADPGRKVTPVADVFEYYARLIRLAGEGVTFHVRRKGEAADAPPTPITVPPGVRLDAGARMRMGDVVATRKNSPANGVVLPGDQITDVEFVDADGTIRVYAAAPAAAAGKVVAPLDPLKLPHDLNRWAARKPGSKAVKLTVLRDVDHTRKPVQLNVTWDEAGQYDITRPGSQNAPQAVNGLGLAYQVQAVVDAVTPAGAAAGLQPNDAVTAVRLKFRDHGGEESTGKWGDIKPHQWASVDYQLQQGNPVEISYRVTRAGKTEEVTVKSAPDDSCPTDDRGLDMAPEFRVMLATGVGDAIEKGTRRTVRSIKTIYMNLYAMAFGRVSIENMSGPITLARASYILAGEDVYRLMLLLALISINLAVVNFLPIPVLDGGHMMFLTYEAIRGKPAPESLQTVLTFAGLGLILLMMVFVIGLDMWRLGTMLLEKL